MPIEPINKEETPHVFLAEATRKQLMRELTKRSDAILFAWTESGRDEVFDTVSYGRTVECAGLLKALEKHIDRDLEEVFEDAADEFDMYDEDDEDEDEDDDEEDEDDDEEDEEEDEEDEEGDFDEGDFDYKPDDDEDEDNPDEDEDNPDEDDDNPDNNTEG